MPPFFAPVPLLVAAFVLEEIVTHYPLLLAAEGACLGSFFDKAAEHTLEAAASVAIAGR